MSSLWNVSDAKRNDLVDAFTVGDDYLLDQDLLPYDLEASKAHATMLLKMGVLTEVEEEQLHKGLNKIFDLWKKGEFQIRPEQEDGHTAIESYLTEHYGEVGKKIHTGRSRNDQALVMIRLFLREQAEHFKECTQDLVVVFQEAEQKHGDILMPGYTHMQKAMPTTVGKWFGAFGDGISDSLPFIHDLQKLLNQNPLGSASGFGIRNFAHQREITTDILNFKKIQENPLYCGLSRGLFESTFCNILTQPILLFSRFISDILFFTSEGKQIFSLPEFLTTGSSIMPQKRNLDTAEIFRGKVKQFLNAKREVEDLQNGLLSGYNRDSCLLKGSIIRALTIADELFSLTKIFVQELRPQKEHLQKEITEDLLITEKIYDLVAEGIPFREAYQKVKKEFLRN